MATLEFIMKMLTILMSTDTGETLWITHHIQLSTSKAGYILDHRVTKATGTIKVTNSKFGSFLSDQCSVTITINYIHNIERKTITSQNYKKLDMDAVKKYSFLKITVMMLSH